MAVRTARAPPLGARSAALRPPRSLAQRQHRDLRRLSSGTSDHTRCVQDALAHHRGERAGRSVVPRDARLRRRRRPAPARVDGRGALVVHRRARVDAGVRRRSRGSPRTRRLTTGAPPRAGSALEHDARDPRRRPPRAGPRALPSLDVARAPSRRRGCAQHPRPDLPPRRHDLRSRAPRRSLRGEPLFSGGDDDAVGWRARRLRLRNRRSACPRSRARSPAACRCRC